MTEPRATFPFEKAFEQFWISPTTNWQRFFNPQVYLSYNYGDADIENHVLERVGSYGRQLGRIIDALGLLIARLPEAELTPQERLIADRFRELSRGVDAAVEEFRGPRKPGITRDEIDHVVERVRDLAASDPEAHRAIVERLKRGVASPAP